MILLTVQNSGADSEEFIDPLAIVSVTTLAGETEVQTLDGRKRHVTEKKATVMKLRRTWLEGRDKNPKAYAVQWFGDQPRWLV